MTIPETDALIERVLELDAKATPGEWEPGVDEPPNAKGYGGYLYSLHVYGPPPIDEDHDQLDIAWCSCSQDPSQGGEHAPKLKRARANAALIAFYRTAAPDLAKRLKAATEALSQCKRDLEEADDLLIAKSTEIYPEGIRCWLCMGEGPRKGTMAQAAEIEHEADCPVASARKRREAGNV